MTDAMVNELHSEAWLMEPKRLVDFMKLVSSLPAPEMVARGPIDPYAPLFELKGSTAVIPISGTLMKRAPAWMKWFGINVTDTTQLRAAVQQAAEDPKVRTILFHIDSPGGQAAGVLEAGDAIFAARQKKQVHAVVDGLAASGAFWLASQAQTITAPQDALVGSIGVYQVVWDESKAAEQMGVKVHVVRSGEHKGMGVPGAPITEAQLAMMQSVVDGLAGIFMGAVARGRAQTTDQIKAMATGQVWLATEAKAQGLVDRVEPVSKALSRLITKESAMADTNTNPVDDAKAAVAAERKRVADIKSAFPKHAAFALDQIELGASLEHATAAFKDLRIKELEAQAEASAKALAEAQAPKPVQVATPAVGAPPVPRGADPQASAGQDFMTVSRALAAEKGIKLTEAMSRISATQPDLYRKFRTNMVERAPEIAARKHQLGIR